MKSNIIIYISNDNNEYDVYRFYASTLKDAEKFLKYSEIHLTPIVNRVHAKIVDDATGICKYSFRMGNFDVNAHINHKNTPTDIETLKN